MKTCVSSNFRQVKSNNRCIGCPNFNLSASGENYDQKISSLDNRRLDRGILPSLTKSLNYPQIYFVD